MKTRKNQILKLSIGVLMLLVMYTLALTTSKEPEAAEVYVIAECSFSPTNWTCDEELRVLTEAIYFEARGEDTTGQLWVGWVINNRVDHPSFPNTIPGVVYEGVSHKLYTCQFSYVCDGKSENIKDIEAWENIVDLALHIYYRVEDDPTNGALFYHNPAISGHLNFFKTLQPISTVGNHAFFTIPKTKA